MNDIHKIVTNDISFDETQIQFHKANFYLEMKY